MELTITFKNEEVIKGLVRTCARMNREMVEGGDEPLYTLHDAAAALILLQLDQAEADIDVEAENDKLYVQFIKTGSIINWEGNHVLSSVRA